MSLPVNRQLGLPLAAGLLSALLFVSLVKGVALGFALSYAAPLPLMMAGLGVGMGALAIAGVVGAASVAMVAGGFSALPFLVAALLPALVVTNRAMLCRTPEQGPTEWYPPGFVLAWLTAAGLALMFLGVGLLAGHPEGVRGWVQGTLSRMVDLLAAEVPADARTRAVTWWTPLFPAMVVSSWLVMAAVNAAGAQGLLARLEKARRPSPSYAQLMLPDWMGMVLVLFVPVAVLADGDIGYVAANAAVVALVPFMFLGLAGIHQWVKGRPQARLVLAVTYGLLILAFGWAALAAAGLGLVRFWTMRFRRGDSGGGMEG